MKFRPLTPDGDMTAGLPMLEDHEACIAALRSRLALMKGEWWERPEVGFGVPDFLREDLRREEGLRAFGNMITAYLAETEGVRAVRNPSWDLKDHRFLYSCDVETQWSQSASVTAEIPF